ncbi:MAG TPA: hypothetical protein PKE55_09800 [Kiritimatiellia bacterium]|nr:hypothetical protein [Kiritimatiellia bacterium]
MISVDLDSVAEIAKQLDQLGIPYAFTGGIVIGLLLDNPKIIHIRPTDDVDAITAVFSHLEYTKIEEALRNLDFKHDTSDGAPACRFLYHGTKVDVMPAKDPTGRFSDRWFEYAVKSSGYSTLNSLTIRTVSASCFIATKLTAFDDRGNGDYASHDIEDIITVIDGRRAIVDEINAEEPSVREFISNRIGELLKDERFIDLLPGHLGGDETSQQRLPKLLDRLRVIARLGADIA